MPPRTSPRTPPRTPPRAWQRMLSGRRLDLLDPSPLDIELEDIAHGLARVARWNGQTSGDHIFSVAQHSLLVEAIASSNEPTLDQASCLTILLHDAAEYVVGDMISPFKAVIGDEYRAVEKRILAAVMVRFGLPAVIPKATAQRAKQADVIAAYHEAVHLAGFSASEADRIFGPCAPLGRGISSRFLNPWPAVAAKTQFIDRFSALAHGTF